MSAVREAVVTAIKIASYKELLLDAGGPKAKQLGREGAHRNFENLTTLAVSNLDLAALEDDSFDEVHAYHILQKLGGSGDAATFFAVFSELWRILKPDGLLCFTLPPQTQVWADPGNVRAITFQTITFLQQPEYDKQCGVTWMSDYRDFYQADFDASLLNDDGREMRCILRAVKPSRCSKL